MVTWSRPTRAPRRKRPFSARIEERKESDSAAWPKASWAMTAAIGSFDALLVVGTDPLDLGPVGADARDLDGRGVVGRSGHRALLPERSNRPPSTVLRT